MQDVFFFHFTLCFGSTRDLSLKWPCGLLLCFADADMRCDYCGTEVYSDDLGLKNSQSSQ